MISRLRSLGPDAVSPRWAVLAIALFALALLLPTSPRYQGLPGQDSGVFLYIGRSILDGDVPYRDVWDHKPPGIYFVNALGLALGGGSRWGVWALGLLSLTVAGLLSLMLLRRHFGMLIAGAATSAWMAATLYIFEEGNFTEEFTLPLQFAAIYLFFDAERTGSYGWRSWALGATGMMAFLLRPNAVGIWVALLIYIVASWLIAGRRGPGIRTAASIAAGGVFVALQVGIYLRAAGALGEFWDCRPSSRMGHMSGLR